MWPRRISLFLVALTFCLLIAGGLVHSTGSSLACPDWPLCYGKFFPQMVNGVEFEHTHRLIAGSVAILTTVLAVLVFRNRKKFPHLSKYAFAAVGIVLFQAVLGGLTVIYKLPTLISTAHLATSMFFFSLLIFLALRLHAQNFGATDHPALHRLRPWLGLGALLVYSQIILGALVRHTGAGSVCTTIPLCDNALWPSAAHATVKLHMAHRIWGVVVGLYLFAIAPQMIRAGLAIGPKNLMGRFFSFFGMALPLLVCVQIALGIFSVITYLGLAPVTAHLGVGALMLGVMVCLWQLARMAAPAAQPHFSLLGDIASLAKVRLSLMVLIVMAVGYFLAPESRLLPLAYFFWSLAGISLLVIGAAFLNAYFERDSDALMERTRTRPLPMNRLQPRVILILGIVCALIAVPLLIYKVNALTALLGSVAYLSYALLYTPLKAQTSFAALVGAIPGALPPLLGWTAATGRVDAVGATLFFILFLWQMPHFFAIALYRIDDYSHAGTQVMPLAQGERLTKKLMTRYAAMLLPVSLFLVPLGAAGRLYFFIALTLGLIFFGWTCFGWKKFTPDALKVWARSLFIFSLVYLPVLFIALLFDSRLQK